MCVHGPLALRVSTKAESAGRSYYSCRLRHGDPERCPSTFIWFADTPAGRALCQQQAAAPAHNSTVSTSSGVECASAVQPRPVLTLASPMQGGAQRAVTCGQDRVCPAARASRSVVSAPAVSGVQPCTAIDRFLAANAAASARRPVQQREYEVSRALGCLQRIVAEGSASGTSRTTHSGT